MTRENTGKALFWGATLLALLLYGVTAPAGLPYNTATHLALAYGGVIYPPPVMAHPVWGYVVGIFGGHYVALACVAAALTIGLMGVLANRYLGWRAAIGACIFCLFMPPVWNDAITGEIRMLPLLGVVLAIWLANAAVLAFIAKISTKRGERTLAQKAGMIGATWREILGKWNLVASRVWLASSVLFAIIVASLHDYKLGEAASVYARDIRAEAGNRIIILNGVADDQIEAESTGEFSCLSLRADPGYREKLMDWVARTWPNDTTLRTAAQVGPSTFAEMAQKKFPDRFYRMNGRDTTREGWERRWANFAPYLESRDPFVPIARHVFGYEANAIANGLSDNEAWKFYWRIYDEIDRGNFSALVNLSELVRKGYAATDVEKRRITDDLDNFFKNAHNRRYAREIARAAGPVKPDPELLSRMEAESKKRIAERVAKGEILEIPEELQSLIEWNEEMVAAIERGEYDRAGNIARAILANPKCRGFIPANAVLATVAAMEGDYVSSEAFFRTATQTTNAIPPVVCNDYADTLMHLGKLDEAEHWARRAIAETPPTFWLPRLTLAEVLLAKAATTEKGSNAIEDEVRELLRIVSLNGPDVVREEVRQLKRKAGMLR